MSEPDAVPLPRDGAVFFDVRGEARSMRLSWYADSAVAVFSIWQGNRCTGTFRLPFGDLDRMVHTLQSGPPSRNADTRFREPGGTAFAGHQESYPVTASHLVPDHPGHPDYRPRRQSAGVDYEGQRYEGQRYAGRGYEGEDYEGQQYQGQGYSGPAEPDHYARPAGYRDRQSAPGYMPAPGHGETGQRGSQDYHGAPGYQGGPEYQGTADYHTTAGYGGSTAYHGAAEHQAPGQAVGSPGYVQEPTYGEPGDYSDAGGYTDPRGYPGPAGYQEAGSYAGAHGYQDQPVAAGEWLAAPTGTQMPGRHGDYAADPGEPPHSAGPRGDRQDSDWEAATAAYRAV